MVFRMQPKISVLVILTIALLIGWPHSATAQRSSSQNQPLDKLDISPEEIVFLVNKVRSGGCTCGSKRKSAVNSVEWNNQLVQSSHKYAKELYTYKRFSHTGRYGSVIGERVDATGYYWQFVGENIAEGYYSFRESFTDWLKSPSHCELIMDGRMQDMAVSRYGKYWVMHMATPMPENKDRVNVKYRTK